MSCDASHFDESYASPGINGKNYGLSLKDKQKNFFLQCHLLSVPTLDQ